MFACCSTNVYPFRKGFVDMYSLFINLPSCFTEVEQLLFSQPRIHSPEKIPTRHWDHWIGNTLKSQNVFWPCILRVWPSEGGLKFAHKQWQWKIQRIVCDMLSPNKKLRTYLWHVFQTLHYKNKLLTARNHSQDFMYPTKFIIWIYL